MVQISSQVFYGHPGALCPYSLTADSFGLQFRMAFTGTCSFDAGLRQKESETTMKLPMTTLGIPMLAEVSRGSHLCHFYESADDLLSLLAPYFEAGLKSNEFCLWIVESPLSVGDATRAMESLHCGFEGHREKGQIEIISAADWYGSLDDADAVLRSSISKLDRARTMGYDGLRIAGNLPWRDKAERKRLIDYESTVNAVMGSYPIVALCAFPLNACSPYEVFDLMSVHRYAVLRRDDRWTLIENAGRVKCDEALEEKEATLRSLLDATTESAFLIDTEGHLLAGNQRLADAFGTTIDTMTGMCMYNLLPPEVRDKRKRIVDEVVRSGTSAQLDDERAGRQLRHSVFPVRTGKGEVTKVAVYVRDITEQTRAAEALARSEGEYRFLVENANSVILRVDKRGIIIFFNEFAQRFFGYDREEIVGKSAFGKILPETDSSGRDLHAMFDDFFVHPDLYPYNENENVRRNGESVWISWTNRLIRNEDGSAREMLSVGQDITERKQLEEQLRRAHKMEAIGTLAGGIAHDFNNILAAMIGFAELAADDIPADSRAQHRLKRVYEAGLRARELVRQILAFSRKSEGERKKISITSLVRETHALLRASLPTTIEMPLASATTEDYVLADPAQIQQVIMNLATNGAHAMRDGGQLAIAVSSVTFASGSLLPDPEMEPGAFVKLTVKDTGTGMTDEVRQRIFEPFFTTKEVGKGTGMGLAVVYGIVKSHGGTVTVKSEVGQGSIFEVYLPRAQKPEITGEETTISTLPTGTERILFVDDEELLVEMARHMLESLGYHVTVATNGRKAWKLFLEDPSQFDLIITDQTMPDTTGLILAQKMLRVRKEMPIILCTGYSEMVSADKAKEAGISEFVMKPVVRKELAETIRRVLDGRRARV
jgi:PAS domain S-box-containing protein